MIDIDFSPVTDITSVSGLVALATNKDSNGEVQVIGYPQLNALAKGSGAKASLGEALLVCAPENFNAQSLLLCGLETTESSDNSTLNYEEILRQAAGNATSLKQDLPITFYFPTTSPEQVQALALGAILGAYRFDKYLTKKPARPISALICHDQDLPLETKTEIFIQARAIYSIRDLVNTSPSELYPQSFSQLMTERAKEIPGVEIEIWNFQALQEQGFGAIVGVGKGSKRPPCLIKLSWNPENAKNHVALVGKGITFDSGGLSLKPATSMLSMKTDMTGAATMANTLFAVAESKLPVRVTAWLAMAENMVSGSAQRPDDVVISKSGTSIEITNTDAEGRLVLADALTMAISENPDLVIDIATLTGAQIVALGERVSGVMGSAKDEICMSATKVGEEMWPMPLPAHLRSNLDSSIADIANSAKKRVAGMLVAGIFLSEFVKDFPWAHIDIAGPSFNDNSPWGYTPKGGTGVALRTLLQVIKQRA